MISHILRNLKCDTVETSLPQGEKILTKNQGEKTLPLLTSEYFSTTQSGYGDYVRPKNSFKLLAWITNHSTLRREARIIALEIASYYNPTTGYAYPTYENLKIKTGIKDRMLSEAIKEMKLSGEWLVVPYNVRGGSKAVSNRYIPLSPLPGDRLNELNEWVPVVKHADMESYRKFLKTFPTPSAN